MNLGAIQEVQKMVESGRHLVWNEAVKLLQNDKTPSPLMKLMVEEAFLVVAFTHGDGNWGLLTSSITKENPLSDIAAMYQAETIFGGVNQDGTCFFLKTADTPVREPAVWNGIFKSGGPVGTPDLSAFPIGLVVIGRTCDGSWANEFIAVHGKELAEELGRPLEEEKKLMNDFIFEAADMRIAERQRRNAMSETKSVRSREAIRRDGDDVYFPIPVFLGDGTGWIIDLSTNKFLWIHDLRDPMTYDGSTDLKIQLNRSKPWLRIPVLGGYAQPGVNHIRIKTVKGGKFALVVSERSLTFHGNGGFLPLEESMSTYSEFEAVRIVESTENLHFVRSGKTQPRFYDLISQKVVE